MKANELRLENLVESLESVLTVDTITSGSSVDLRTAEGKIYNTPLELCKPIPLTEEWLLKFGFEKIEAKTDRILYRFNSTYNESLINFEMHLFNNGGVSIFDINNNTGFGNRLTTMNYVHQLQNLYFALTNEELIIK